MSELFECGDTGALVAYLYDECEPEERSRIAEHLARCASCSEEVDGLGETRRRMAAWTPPMPALGFQLPAQDARVPWWRAPLPAWAQAAAAVLIFGAGLAIGLARDTAGTQPVVAPRAAVTSTVAPVTRTDLSDLEQRLRAEMTQVRTSLAAPAPQVVPSDDAVMKKVESLVEQSEERQRREFTLRSVEMARDFEAQRRVDLATVRETVGQLQGVTGAEFRQQREAIDRINNYMIRVSQQPR